MTGWPTQRLGRFARTIGGSGFPHEHQGKEAGELPFVKVSDLKLEGNKLGVTTAVNYVSREVAQSLGARVIPPESVVFPKVGAALLGNARSLTLTPCLIDNNMMAVVPTEGDARFLRYSLLTQDLGELSGSGPLPFVTESQVRDLYLPFPSVVEQRRIADFLDVETVRIDRVSEARSMQIKQLSVRVDSMLSEHAWKTHDKKIVVKRLISKITSGPRGWGDFVADEGSLFIRIANVSREGIDLDLRNIARVNVPSGAERARTLTKDGDVLVSITADIGSVAVVDDAAAGANVSQHLALLRPLSFRCDSRWLAYSLRAPQTRQVLLMNSYGGTKVGLGLSDVANVEIPMLDISEQRRRSNRLDRMLDETRRLRTLLTNQLRLLAERRQALVVAAVTGEFDVSTGRGADLS